MLILIYRRLSVQLVTTTSQFTLSERNGLIYKPHPRFLAENLSKKVRLIHESLRYLMVCFNKYTGNILRYNVRYTAKQNFYKVRVKTNAGKQ